jgi:hypothetical protein
MAGMGTMKMMKSVTMFMPEDVYQAHAVDTSTGLARDDQRARVAGKPNQDLLDNTPNCNQNEQVETKAPGECVCKDSSELKKE